MCRIRKLAAFLTLIVAAGVALAAEAAPRPGPCAEIAATCEQAGFVRGGAKAGNGLAVDCIAPIMQGSAQPRRASKPLPPIDPQLVEACKARNPNFGQRKAAPPPGAAPPPAAPPRP